MNSLSPRFSSRHTLTFKDRSSSVYDHSPSNVLLNAYYNNSAVHVHSSTVTDAVAPTVTPLSAVA